jgi:hypothetical protein
MGGKSMSSQRGLPFFSVVVGVTLLATPIAGLPLAELEALNRELGRLCRNPPPEALVVCRIHARLIRVM